MQSHFAGCRADAGRFATTRQIHPDGTCAMLRQGRRDGWTADSYRRIADYFDGRDAIACLYWCREARRSRQ